MRGRVRITASVVLALTLAAGASARRPVERPGKRDLDRRLPTHAEGRGGFVMREPTPDQRAAAAELVSGLGDVRLRWDGMSGAPKWIAAAPDSCLAPPATGRPEAIARGFLRGHSRLFGLAAPAIERLETVSVVPAGDGGSYVHLIQQIGGIEVFGSHVNVSVRADGAVRSVSSRLFGGVPAGLAAAVRPSEAATFATRGVYPGLRLSPDPVSEMTTGERRTVFRGEGFGFPPEARLVLFPEADGVRLAWEVRVAEPSLRTSYRILIDARDGGLLFRRNTTQYADARYLDAHLPEPQTEEHAPAAHVLGTIPSSTPESPNGWISGGGSSLEGNNAVSHLGYHVLPGLGDPLGVYDYPFNTSSAALVNAWWWVNDAHDRFYDLGFTELRGNFQQSNFGMGAAEGDPMHVSVAVSGSRNDAWYTGNPDGGRGTINFTWYECRFCGDHDGYPEPAFPSRGERAPAFDRYLVYHEYVHGITNRMVGGRTVNGCLGGTQSAAMGEGWSDLFAASLFDEPRFQDYAMEGLGALDMRHDLTYDDLCTLWDFGGGPCEEHADGLIWEGALWDLRESMRALDPANGLDEFHRILVEALNGTACDPDMLDARGAIVQADTDLYSSAHHDAIWAAFAGRGMGDKAISSGENDTDPVTDYSVPVPNQCTPPSDPTGLAAAPEGDNAIRLNYAAPGASAVAIRRDDLDNPLDGAEWIASTTDTATYLDTTVQGGKSYRYQVVALGPAGISCDSGPSGTAAATATGLCAAPPVFDPGVAVADGDPGCGVTVSWSPAQPGCPASPEPLVYDLYRAPTPGFEPLARTWIGRTAATSFVDHPPETIDDPIYAHFGYTWYYLVLARHGDPADPPDHSLPGPSQILEWAPGLPTLGRTPVLSWTFDAGPEGWTADNAADPVGGWTLADPSPTYYAAALLAPDEAAGGAGMAWVTGDAGGPSRVAEFDNDGVTYLTSPVWDGSTGATILSFDYWSHILTSLFLPSFAGIELEIGNGTDQVRVGIAGLKTVQIFETAGRHGWQRAELDLARHIAPTSTMSVTFVSYPDLPVSELGIDDVRVESATACSRSGLRITGVTVDDSPPGWGNGNGVLDPGETARLTLDVINDGSATAFAPVGTLVGRTPGVRVHEESVSFADIPPAGGASSTGDGITVTAPDDRGCAESVVLDFEVMDAAGTVASLSWANEFGYPVSETVFADTFETDKGWQATGQPGGGRWQRGDPVGTTNGADPANPEDDSPSDAGAQCYVTENGLPGGAAGATDVDAAGGLLQPYLYSPWLDLSAYKRARAVYDLWYYDDSNGDPIQDYGELGARNRRPLDDFEVRYQDDPTGGWVSTTLELAQLVALSDEVRLAFTAYDRSPDHIVEMGIDNVVVEGDRQTCDPLGVADPPNGIGDTLRVGKQVGMLALSWQAAPVDVSHDGAAYYEVYESGAPDAGFAVVDTAAVLQANQSLDPPSAFYLVSAVNSAGTSGDEPAP